MSSKRTNRKPPRWGRKRQLPFFLTATVSLVLLVLILTGSRQTGLVVLAVTIILTVLILAVTGTPELLPATLRAILSEIRRMLRPDA